MNTYISDSIARAHADRMMADAAAARRARRVRAARRAAGTRASRHESPADRSPDTRARGPVVAAHIAARPFTAFHSWLVAGQL